MNDVDKGRLKIEEARFHREGVHHRENMDALTVKALVALNGAGSIALLTFSSALFALSPEAMETWRHMQQAAFIAILLLIGGLASAVIYNICRRSCSLAHTGLTTKQPSGREPFVCRIGHTFKALSLAFFVAGAMFVPLTDLCTWLPRL